MLPCWTAFLRRVYAWKGLLTEHGWAAEAIEALLVYAGAPPGLVGCAACPG